MSTEEANASLHLASLPSDIIRKIVKIGRDSVDELRLVGFSTRERLLIVLQMYILQICPRWNFLVLEHFSTLPGVKCMRLCNTRNLESDHYMYLSMTFDNHHANRDSNHVR